MVCFQCGGEFCPEHGMFCVKGHAEDCPMIADGEGKPHETTE